MSIPVTVQSVPITVTVQDQSPITVTISAVGTPGPGVPVGGTTGQVLAKIDATDYNTQWVTGGGGGGAVDSVNGQTGVVVLTKTDIGLSNVDNTSDANKPVSTAQQTALDLKANLASPALTGTPTAPTQTPGENTTRIATDAFVNAAVTVETSRATTAEALLVPQTRNVNTTSPITGGGALSSDLTLGINQSLITIAESQVTGLTSDLAGKLPVSNPAFTGTETTGTLTFSDTGELIAVQSSVNSYNQIVIQNSNSGASASSDFVVANDQTTNANKYGDFGMNSSGFTGTGPLSAPGEVYLTSTGQDLAIGTTSANAVHIVANNSSTDALTVDSANVARVPTRTANDNSTAIASTAYVDSKGGKGYAIVDFGSFPGLNKASVSITGLTGIQSTDVALANIVAGAYGVFTADDISMMSSIVEISCTVPTSGTGFTIFAQSVEKLQGQVQVAWKY